MVTFNFALVCVFVLLLIHNGHAGDGYSWVTERTSLIETLTLVKDEKTTGKLLKYEKYLDLL